MLKTLRNLFLLLALSAPLTTFAQDKVENGGDTEEIEFKIIAKKMNKWFESDANVDRFNKAIDQANLEALLRAEDVQQALKIAVDVVSINFTNKNLQLSSDNEIYRVCLNYDPATGILCNRKAWNTTSVSKRYLLVFHELMGITGLEKNIHSVSMYDFTLVLAEFVSEIRNEIACDVILKCESSNYSIQIQSETEDGVMITLMKNGSTRVPKNVSMSLLDIASDKNGKARAYIEVTRSGLFAKKTILQCNP